MPEEIVDERYVLVRLLGSGGMGNVYEAVHRGTGRRVAIKVLANSELANDREAVRRFQREAKAAASVDTPHIAEVLDAGSDRVTGFPFMAMEILTGYDVKELGARLGALEPTLSLRIVAQACSGLEKAHEAGIVHRDIKPANLFLAAQRDGRLIVKVLDFGIAKLPSGLLANVDASAATTTGKLLGSPLFMSPEQVRGLKTLDHRTDIWSLGAVLYQALAGRPPFAESETVGQLMVTICSQPPPSLEQVAPWVPPEIVSIVDRSLSIDPDRRFPTAHALFDAISALLPEGIEIDADSILSASGQRISVHPSGERAGWAPTQSLDDPQCFISTPPIAVDTSRRVTPGRISDRGPGGQTTMRSSGEPSSPTSNLPLQPRKMGQLAFASFGVLGAAAGVWYWTSQASRPPAAAEPTSSAVQAAATASALAHAPIRDIPVAIEPPATQEAGTSLSAPAAERIAAPAKDGRRRPISSAVASAATEAPAPSPPTLPTTPLHDVTATAPPFASASAPPSASSRWRLERTFPTGKVPQ